MLSPPMFFSVELHSDLISLVFEREPSQTLADLLLALKALELSAISATVRWYRPEISMPVVFFNCHQLSLIATPTSKALVRLGCYFERLEKLETIH